MAAGQPAERTAEVVVVGAGPAALLLTELLARAGNQVVIVERQADPTQVTQSVMLQPSTLGILRRLGLPRLAAPEVGRIAGLEEYGPDGQLFSGRYASLPDPPATYGQIVSQGELRRILLAQVRRSPNVTVLTSTTVHRLLRHEIGDCRMETVAAGGSGGPTRLVSSWVVAADGKHSAVRQLAMIDATVSGFAHSMFLTPIPTPPGTPRLIRMHRRPTGLVVTVPEAAPGITYLFTHTTGNGAGGERLLHHCSEIIGPGDPVLAAAAAAAARSARIIPIEPQTVSAGSWRSGGVVLLGDSAHAMHSFGAQGLNIAMQNAALLGAALRHAGNGDAFELDAIERRRRPYVASLQHAQRELGSQFWPPDQDAARSWFAERFDDFALGQPEFRPRWQSFPTGA